MLMAMNNNDNLVFIMMFFSQNFWENIEAEILHQ